MTGLKDGKAADNGKYINRDRDGEVIDAGSDRKSWPELTQNRNCTFLLSMVYSASDDLKDIKFDIEYKKTSKINPLEFQMIRIFKSSALCVRESTLR